MATSGSYSFTVNRDQILRMAALNLCKLDELEQLSPQETIDMSMFLNMLVKQWQGKADFAPGLKMFTRRRGHLFLSGITGQSPVSSSSLGWTNTYVQTTTTGLISAGASSFTVASASGMTVGDHIGVDQDAGTLYWSTILTIVGTTITIAGVVVSQASSGAMIYGYTTTAQQ